MAHFDLVINEALLKDASYAPDRAHIEEGVLAAQIAPEDGSLSLHGPHALLFTLERLDPCFGEHYAF